MARDDGQAGGAAAGQGQAQVDVFQQLQGGGRERRFSGQAGASSRQRGANSRFQLSSTPSLGLIAGSTGARAPGSLVRPLVAAHGAIAAVRNQAGPRVSHNAPPRPHRQPHCAGVNSYSRAGPTGCGWEDSTLGPASSPCSDFSTHPFIHSAPEVGAFYPDPDSPVAHTPVAVNSLLAAQRAKAPRGRGLGPRHAEGREPQGKVGGGWAGSRDPPCNIPAHK